MPDGTHAAAAAEQRLFFVDRHRAPAHAPLVIASRYGGHVQIRESGGDPTDLPELAGPVSTGARRLVGAVVWQALVDVGVVAHATPKPLETVKAQIWFASDDVSWPYSFVNCCAVLGLEPAAVRAALVDRNGGRLALRLLRRVRI